MPTYDYECDTFECKTLVEKVLPMSERNDPGPCPKCGGTLARIYLASGSTAQSFDPVVIHESADGRVRFPGHVNAPCPDGFVRRELRTTAEVRQFEKRVNGIEQGKINRKVEIDCEALERMEHENRRELRSAMERMSPQQRAFAKLAIALNNARRPKGFEPGFYVDAFSNDASNREEYRDKATNWRPGRR